MPWCEDCSKFWTPTSLRPDGTCPTCGRQVAQATAVDDRSADGAGAGAGREGGEDVAVPWHFKLLLVAIAVYLAYRAYQGVGWLIHHL